MKKKDESIPTPVFKSVQQCAIATVCSRLLLMSILVLIYFYYSYLSIVIFSVNS